MINCENAQTPYYERGNVLSEWSSKDNIGKTIDKFKYLDLEKLFTAFTGVHNKPYTVLV